MLARVLNNVLFFVLAIWLLLLAQNISYSAETELINVRIYDYESNARIVLDFSGKIETPCLREKDYNKTQIVINANLSDDIDNVYTFLAKKELHFYQKNDQLVMDLDINIDEIYVYSDNYSKIFVNIEASSNQCRNKKSKKIYQGIFHSKHYLRGPVLANVLDIDLNNYSIELSPAIARSGTIFSKTSVNSISSRNKAIVGINASFFKPPSGLPLGILVINRELYTGPILNRIALVIDDDNIASIKRLKLDSSVNFAGKNYQVNNYNQPRMGLNGFMVYSDKWTSYVPKTLRNEFQLSVEDNKVVQKTKGSIKVPNFGYVITGPAKSDLAQLNVGDEVSIKVDVMDEENKIKHAIAGGPYLVRNGEVFIDAKAQKFTISPYARAPRTAVGITKDNHLLLVTVDGRQSKSIGMTFYELARFMKTIGSVDAMNFDGGSSTQMIVQGKLANKATVRGGASVSTAVIVKPSRNIVIVKNNNQNNQI